ncbi:MAG: response regulator [Chloroflexales bacterium]
MEIATVKILIVDDEPDLCWALERMIRASNTVISTASCAAEAIKLVGQHSYDVAFIDAILPDANGIQLAQRIVTISPGTSIILMSGYYYHEDMSSHQAHIAGFLAKPFLISDVRAILQHALRQTGASRSSTYAPHTAS